MHRVGGLEKEDGTGNVSYEPENHQKMTNFRRQKVKNVAKEIGSAKVDGPEKGKLLVISWGGTYGACHTAVRRCQQAGKEVAHVHLRWVNPFPLNLGEIISNYDQVLVPELNTGQLSILIRNEYVVDAKPFNKVQGKPFRVGEVVAAIEELV